MDAKQSEAGFTLVEILVVLAIISMLAGVVAINIWPQINFGKQTKAQEEIATFKGVLEQYAMVNGGYPTTEQGLEALVECPKVPPIPENYPPGGYLDTREIPHDPWGNPYVYFVPGRHGERYEIISFGADGMEGGEGADADISSATLR